MMEVDSWTRVDQAVIRWEFTVSDRAFKDTRPATGFTEYHRMMASEILWRLLQIAILEESQRPVEPAKEFA